jgi:hypothetical protein
MMSLNAQDIVSINSARGIVFVKDGPELVGRQLTISTNGDLSTRPIEPKVVDQFGNRKPVSVHERWAETDQSNAL